MPAQQGQAFRLVAVARADQFRVPPDVPQRHSRAAQDRAQRQPVHVILCVHAAAARRAANGAEEDAFPLVEAERVHAQAGALGDLPDAQLARLDCHAARVQVRPGLIVAARAAAEARGLPRFRTGQPPYSILSRGIERPVLPACQRYRMGVLTWNPLAGASRSVSCGHAFRPSIGVDGGCFFTRRPAKPVPPFRLDAHVTTR